MRRAHHLSCLQAVGDSLYDMFSSPTLHIAMRGRIASSRSMSGGAAQAHEQIEEPQSKGEDPDFVIKGTPPMLLMLMLNPSSEVFTHTFGHSAMLKQHSSLLQLH